MSDYPRIFDQLTQPRAMFGQSFSQATSPLPPAISRQVRAAVRVVADSASEWYWQSTQDVWDMDDDFGPLRMPFDLMFIDWHIPVKCFAEGEWGEMPKGMRAGVLLTRCDPGEDAPIGTVEAIIWNLAVASGNLPPVPMPGTGMVFIGEAGQHIGSKSFAAEGTDVMVGQSWVHAKVAFLALSLMNCKNISLEPVSPERIKSRRSGKKARNRVAKLAFHTIKLPAPASAPNAEKSAAMGGTIAFHKVRGHFATYSEAAPLFGKYTGTFWKPWHARGAKSNGIIVSDYEVSPA